MVLGLGVDPEQHGHLGPRRPGGAQPPDRVGDGRGLGDLVGMGGEPDLGAGRPLGAERHAVAGGAGEQLVGPVDDLRGGAVVADQLDGRGARELLREVAQVVGPGTGEGVDRLGGVADDAQLVTAAQPQVEQGRLERRDVLELVDDEPLVLRPDLGGDPLVVGEHPGGEEQHVLHVHAALVALAVLVGGEDLGDHLGLVTRDLAPPAGRHPRVVVGVDVADLGPLDLGGQVAQQRLVGGDPAAPRRAREHAQLGLRQRRQLAAVDVGPEEPQLPQRRGVEGAGLHPGGPEQAQPGAHLAGGPRREGDGEHLGRLVDPGGHAVGDPVGDRPGLAGPGACEHPHRAVERLGHLALLGVERREQVVGRRHGRNNSGSRLVE